MHCCSIILLLSDFHLILFIFCSTFVFHLNLFVSIFHCSLFMRKILNSDPGLYSRYFDPIVCEVPVIITIYASQLTSYIRLHRLCLSIGASGLLRHSGIDGINILQVVKQADCETGGLNSLPKFTGQRTCSHIHSTRKYTLLLGQCTVLCKYL